MASKILNVRMSEELHADFKAFCESVHIPASTLMAAFAAQTVRLGRVPFEIEGLGGGAGSAMQNNAETPARGDDDTPRSKAKTEVSTETWSGSNHSGVTRILEAIDAATAGSQSGAGTGFDSDSQRLSDSQSGTDAAPKNQRKQAPLSLPDINTNPSGYDNSKAAENPRPADGSKASGAPKSSGRSEPSDSIEKRAKHSGEPKA